MSDVELMNLCLYIFQIAISITNKLLHFLIF